MNRLVGITIGVLNVGFVGYTLFSVFRRKQAESQRRRRSIIRRDTMHRFFTWHLTQGEWHLHHGRTHVGVGHLANAVIICEQPQRFLDLIQEWLPADVYELVREKVDQLILVAEQQQQQRNRAWRHMLHRHEVQPSEINHNEVE
ncbi:mitochondrial import receptor subunit TOM20 homolog [Scaptodrosophila lebanonensis]|uniref:Mitochondrial import receptor subunit TOM20 homolog n=1 Tax=Drosophila lebanonensis TaxID=7225 RepID=A0A6J2TZX6_DROLE|nr:mitochondrial import receptor subunit TOM20 homolog [Scaptodrosophila lebanonensis]